MWFAWSIACLAAAAAPAHAAGDRTAFAEGVELLRQGRAAAALVKLEEARKSRGRGAVPDELLADLAVAAWGAGRPGAAEAYAERAAAKRGSFGFLRDMVVGGARLAEGREGLAGKDPAGLGTASEKARRAVAMFERALGKRPGSAEARRNLERALRLVEELERRKKAAEKKKKKKEGGGGKDGKGGKKGKEEKRKKREGGKDGKKGKEEQRKKREGGKDGKKGKEEKRKQEQAQKKKKKGQGRKREGGRAGAGKSGEKDPRKGRVLTAEQLQRLVRALREIEAQKRKLRAARRPRHVPGKRDW